MSTTSPGSADSQGRVQWVIPPNKSKQTKKISDDKARNRFRCDSQSSNQIHSPTDNQSNSSYNSSNVNNCDYTVLDPSSFNSHEDNREEHGGQQILLDGAICRTICTIVEEYLKELREHQKHINEARSRLIRDTTHESSDHGFIALNDISRLRVRDEQTKAIETIKQLTNYLRELSLLIQQADASKGLVSEEIHNKLSDVRSDIIQALNDFVISNNDIDIPIVDEDLSCRDYDLCAEVHRSSSNINQVEVGQSGEIDSVGQDIGHSTSLEQRKQSLLISIDESGEHSVIKLQQQQQPQIQLEDESKFVELERRKREVQKLERDTVELRRLFADFYKLVKIQSEQVDSIENNLVMAAHHIGEAKHHLSKPMKRLTILVPVTGCITGALIGGPIGLFIGGKLGGVTIICASSLLGLLSSIGAQKCITSNKLKHD